MKAKGLKWFVCALAVTAMAGCASTGGGGGASAEELIQSLLDDMLAALQAQDIDKMISFYGEGFSSDNGDVAATKEFLDGAKEQGFLEDLEIDISELTITVDGDSAKAGPVELEGAFGTLTLSFELAVQNGTWKVTQQAQF